MVLLSRMATNSCTGNCCPKLITICILEFLLQFDVAQLSDISSLFQSGSALTVLDLLFQPSRRVVNIRSPMRISSIYSFGVLCYHRFYLVVRHLFSSKHWLMASHAASVYCAEKPHSTFSLTNAIWWLCVIVTGIF